jgi:hypothetical protein
MSNNNNIEVNKLMTNTRNRLLALISIQLTFFGFYIIDILKDILIALDVLK